MMLSTLVYNLTKDCCNRHNRRCTADILRVAFAHHLCLIRTHHAATTVSKTAVPYKTMTTLIVTDARTFPATAHTKHMNAIVSQQFASVNTSFLILIQSDVSGASTKAHHDVNIWVATRAPFIPLISISIRLTW